MTKKTLTTFYALAYLLISGGVIALANPSWNIISVLIAIPILYGIFETKFFTNDSKVKWAQAFVYIGSITTLIFLFDWTMLLLGIVAGWVLFGVGVSICLHNNMVP